MTTTPLRNSNIELSTISFIILYLYIYYTICYTVCQVPKYPDFHRVFFHYPLRLD